MDKECAYLDTLLQLMESYGYIAMFVAMALENANIPIPSEVVLGFAGFLISQQIFSFWTTFAVACIAGVVGSIISYCLGGIAVIICRCLPGVRTFISFPAGVARYPFWRFVIFTIIGTIPWTLLLVWAGSLLGSHWRDLIQYNHIFLMAIAALCVVAAVVFVWHKRRRRNVA